jgi:predicted Rossmann-fold nucleotide-binding protein
MDELFEALTLIQTGKVQNFPVILFGSSYWSGLVDWLRATMLVEGKIAPADLNLLMITDSLEEVRDLIVKSMQEQGLRPQQEQEAREATRRAFSKERASG